MTITQLSGGQKTLLALAFVLALAEYSSSPLYLLDEIDAALDEGNQCLVADVLQQRFGHVQILCISHHPAFHIRVRIVEKTKLYMSFNLYDRHNLKLH